MRVHLIVLAALLVAGCAQPTYGPPTEERTLRTASRSDMPDLRFEQAVTFPVHECDPLLGEGAQASTDRAIDLPQWIRARKVEVAFTGNGTLWVFVYSPHEGGVDERLAAGEADTFRMPSDWDDMQLSHSGCGGGRAVVRYVPEPEDA